MSQEEAKEFKKTSEGIIKFKDRCYIPLKPALRRRILNEIEEMNKERISAYPVAFEVIIHPKLFVS